MKKTIPIILFFIFVVSHAFGQENAQYYYNQGNKKFIQSDYKSALENFNQALELDSTLYYAYVSRAEVQTELGMYDAALQDYETYKTTIRSLNLLEDPAVIRQMEDLKKLKEEGGSFFSGQNVSNYETYEGINENSESNPSIVVNGTDRWENALDYNPEDLRALFLKGNYLYKNGDYSQALKTLNRAIQLDRTIHNIFNARGYVKLKLNDLYGALDDFNSALSLERDEYFSLVGRGEVKSKLRDFNSSIEDYSRAILQKPNQYPAYYGRAISWFKLKNYAKAIDDFSQTIQIKPDHSKAFFNRGLARYNVEDTKAACVDWQQSSSLGHGKAYDYIQSYCK